MADAPDLAAALAAVQQVRARFGTASSEELLSDVAAVESIGRLVDGLRLECAAEVERRSAKGLGTDSLAFRSGARDGVELVSTTARIGLTEAKRRVGLGSAIAPATSIHGDRLPGSYPLVGEAVAEGAIGVEAARCIVECLQHLRRRVPSRERTLAEAALVEVARQATPEVVRIHAEVWTARLDPDGPEPNDAQRFAKRAFRLGRTGADGTTRFSGVLLPEHLALVKELLQSRRRTGVLFRTAAGGDDACETIDPEWREGEGRKRERSQQDYDTVAETLEAGMRAEQGGAAATAVTHEVIVVAKASDLAARRGVGWTSGVLAGLSIPTIERITCTGGIRLLVTGDAGEPLHLGRTRRVFTTGQKKALIARSGGCGVPGCTVPAPYVEAHHAEWWERDGGPTDIDNALLVCSYHHHLLHAPEAPIRVERHDGDLFVVPRGWLGPPEERHRVQRHPLSDLAHDPPSSRMGVRAA